MKKIEVIKYDGSREVYDQEKVLSSIVRAGVKKEQVLKILANVESQLFNGMPTSRLYQLVAQEIEKQTALKHPYLYRLREALAKIDSLDFEGFISQVLEKQGFTCQKNVIVPGFCVSHQIDVIAKGPNHGLFYVEVKHHRNFHRDSGLGTVTELWARLTGWRYALNGVQSKGLEKMVEDLGLAEVDKMIKKVVN